jgi:dethiobiotin synthetase
MATSRASVGAGRIIFITGTDTGVGKTLLTALLLCHVRAEGAGAHAIKPFCSGDRADALLFHALQGGELTIEQINPFYFPQPLAPWVAARMSRRKIRLAQALRHIRSVRSRRSQKLAPNLLIEGVGGILVPLGERFDVLDLVCRLKCDCIVVARNQLGTINHTRCTVKLMQDAGVQRINVVLMGVEEGDLSVKSNKEVLGELLAPIQVISIPFLGKNAHKMRGICDAAKKLKKSLALLAK